MNRYELVLDIKPEHIDSVVLALVHSGYEAYLTDDTKVATSIDDTNLTKLNLVKQKEDK